MSIPLTGNPHGGTPKGVDHLQGADIISEWYLLKNDLESVIMTAYVLEERSKESKNSVDLLIIRSLTRDMIVQFIACFQNNMNRSFTPDTIFGRWPSELAYYRIQENLRNNYAAHRFGPQRQCRLVTYLENGIPEDFGPVYISFSVPDRDDIMRLSRLAQIALGVVQDHIDDLAQEFFVQVRALTPEQVLGLSDPTFDAPSASQFGLTRNEFKRNPTSSGKGARSRRGSRSG